VRLRKRHLRRVGEQRERERLERALLARRVGFEQHEARRERQRMRARGAGLHAETERVEIGDQDARVIGERMAALGRRGGFIVRMAGIGVLSPPVLRRQ
jgi:hypothetical protein